MMNTTQLLNQQQAADLLCLKPSTLEKWRHQGTGPKFVKLARSTVRYRVTDLEEFIEGKMRESTTGACN